MTAKIRKPSWQRRIIYRALFYSLLKHTYTVIRCILHSLSLLFVEPITSAFHWKPELDNFIPPYILCPVLLLSIFSAELFQTPFFTKLGSFITQLLSKRSSSSGSDRQPTCTELPSFRKSSYRCPALQKGIDHKRTAYLSILEGIQYTFFTFMCAHAHFICSLVGLQKDKQWIVL